MGEMCERDRKRYESIPIDVWRVGITTFELKQIWWTSAREVQRLVNVFIKAGKVRQIGTYVISVDHAGKAVIR